MLTYKTSSFMFHQPPLSACLPPTGTKLLYPKSTFMWEINRNDKAFRKQSWLQPIHSLIFIGLSTTAHVRKSRFVLMGLFWTKEWGKEQNPFRNLTAAWVEHHPAQCRKPAERRPRQTLLDWWPCTVRLCPTLIGVLLSVLLGRRFLSP